MFIDILSLIKCHIMISFDILCGKIVIADINLILAVKNIIATDIIRINSNNILSRPVQRVLIIFNVRLNTVLSNLRPPLSEDSCIIGSFGFKVGLLPGLEVRGVFGQGVKSELGTQSRAFRAK